MGSSPSFPEPTQQELDIQAQQAEALTIQNELMRQQISEAAATREQLAALAPQAADIQRLQELQSQQIEAGQQAIELQRRQLDAFSESFDAQNEFNKQLLSVQTTQLDFAQESLEFQRTQAVLGQTLQEKQVGIAEKQLDLLDAAINAEPTALEQKVEELGILQAERVEKALKGELPVSEATQANKEKQFALLKEQAAAQGIRIEGDTLESATSKSTAGIQQLDSLRRRFDAIEDAERRGEITTGQSLLLQGAQVQSGLAASRTGLAAFNTGAILPQQQLGGVGLGQAFSAPAVQNPFGQATGALQSAGSFGFGLSGQLGGQLQQGFSSALQPFQFNREGQFAANQAGAANTTGLFSSLFGAAGSGLGLAAGLGAFNKRPYIIGGHDG